MEIFVFIQNTHISIFKLRFILMQILDLKNVIYALPWKYSLPSLAFSNDPLSITKL